jgi:hypothetical protein
VSTGIVEPFFGTLKSELVHHPPYKAKDPTVGVFLSRVAGYLTLAKKSSTNTIENVNLGKPGVGRLCTPAHINAIHAPHAGPRLCGQRRQAVGQRLVFFF